MNLKYFIKRYWFIVLAVILVASGSFFSSEAMKWGSYAIGFAVISIGFGISSVDIELQNSKAMKKIDETLLRIENLQQKLHNELSEQKNSGTPIAASLEAISKYYMDYINKQQGEDNK